jgi:hypothetical protein
MLPMTLHDAGCANGSSNWRINVARPSRLRRIVPAPKRPPRVQSRLQKPIIGCGGRDLTRTYTALGCSVLPVAYLGAMPICDPVRERGPLNGAGAMAAVGRTVQVDKPPIWRRFRITRA